MERGRSIAWMVGWWLIFVTLLSSCQNPHRVLSTDPQNNVCLKGFSLAPGNRNGALCVLAVAAKTVGQPLVRKDLPLLVPQAPTTSHEGYEFAVQRRGRDCSAAASYQQGAPTTAVLAGLPDGDYKLCLRESGGEATELTQYWYSEEFSLDQQASPPPAQLSFGESEYTRSSRLRLQFILSQPESAAEFKLCLDSDCQQGCGDLYRQRLSPVVFENLEDGGRYFGCGRSIDDHDNPSAWVSTQQAVLVDLQPPTPPKDVFAIRDLASEQVPSWRVFFVPSTAEDTRQYQVRACSVGCRDCGETAVIKGSGELWHWKQQQPPTQLCLAAEDRAGHVSGWEPSRAALSREDNGYWGGLSLAGGEEASNRSEIRLQLFAGKGVQEYLLCRQPVLEQGECPKEQVVRDWQAFSPDPAPLVVEQQGLMRIYVQYRDGSGRVSKSVGDSLVLDTRAPPLPRFVNWRLTSGREVHQPVDISSYDAPEDWSHFLVKACLAKDCRTGCTEAMQVLRSPALVRDLENSKSYHACVASQDQAGNQSEWVVSSQSYRVDTSPPFPPTLVRFDAEIIRQAEVQLFYQPAADASDFSHHNVKLCEQQDCQTNCIAPAISQSPPAQLRGLEPALGYFGCIQGEDKVGNTSVWVPSSNSVFYDNQAPKVVNPDLEITQDVGVRSVRLRWHDAVDDLTGQDELRYEVYFAGGQAIDSVEAVELATLFTERQGQPLEVVVDNLNPSTTYYINVLAKDAAGNSSIYSGIKVTTKRDDLAPTPGGQGVIEITAMGDGWVALEWQAAATRQQWQGRLNYQLYYSQSPLLDKYEDIRAGVAVDHKVLGSLRAVVTGLQPEQTYHFNVVVEDPGEHHSVYNKLAITTQARRYQWRRLQVAENGVFGLDMGGQVHRASLRLPDLDLDSAGHKRWRLLTGKSRAKAMAAGSFGVCWLLEKATLIRCRSHAQPDQEVLLSSLPGVRFSGIEAAGDRVCGLTADAAVHCWVRVGRARISRAADPRRYGVALVYPGPWRSYSVGNGNLCLVDGNGEVFCDGADNSVFGRFVVEKEDMVKVEGREALAPFRNVIVDHHFGCAQQASGRLQCWWLQPEAQGGMVANPAPWPSVRGWNLDGARLCGRGQAGSGECYRLFAVAQQGVVYEPDSVSMVVFNGHGKLEVAGDGYWCGAGEGGQLSCVNIRDRGLVLLGNRQKDVSIGYPPPMVDFAFNQSGVWGLDLRGRIYYSRDTLSGGNEWRPRQQWLGNTVKAKQRLLPLAHWPRFSRFAGAGVMGPDLCGVSMGSEVTCVGPQRSFASLPRPRLNLRRGVNGVVQEVVSGRRHGCLLQQGGEVSCWGDNSRGQLGAKGRSFMAASPRPIDSQERFLSLAAGHHHTCGVTAAGEVLCWGDGGAGQLGDGPTEPAAGVVPIKVPGVAGVKALSIGVRHSCGLLVGGQVTCWGGGPGSEGREGAVQVRLPGPAVNMASYANRTCVQLSDSRLFCWQGDQLKPSLLPSSGRGGTEPWQKMMLLNQRICGLSHSGTVSCQTLPFFLH